MIATCELHYSCMSVTFYVILWNVFDLDVPAAWQTLKIEHERTDILILALHVFVVV